MRVRLLERWRGLGGRRLRVKGVIIVGNTPWGKEGGGVSEAADIAAALMRLVYSAWPFCSQAASAACVPVQLHRHTHYWQNRPGSELKLSCRFLFLAIGGGGGGGGGSGIPYTALYGTPKQYLLNVPQRKTII